MFFFFYIYIFNVSFPYNNISRTLLAKDIVQSSKSETETWLGILASILMSWLASVLFIKKKSTIWVCRKN